MSRKPRQGECVYCGTLGYITNDHVPPKCLFPPDARLNLVTVPACEKCNSGFRLDDEYFRVIISLRAILPNGSAADFLKDKTRRMLSHPSAEKFSKQIHGAMVPAFLRRPYFSYRVGDNLAIDADESRLEATMERIVRGLFAKYFRHRLPDTHEVSVVIMHFPEHNSALNEPEFERTLALLAKGTHVQFGSVFDCQFSALEEDHNSTIWWIKVYGNFASFCFTLPAEIMGSEKSEQSGTDH